jgi:hypothetical protein
LFKGKKPSKKSSVKGSQLAEEDEDMDSDEL